ncbi:MAG: hypothetical protein R3205_09920, partial [Psychrobacter sp.]|nr:hypothetical protein [Psychrobacter sp.]
MTVSTSSTPSFMPARLVSFAGFDNNTEQFHNAVRAQLSQDIEVLFAYAELPSPLIDACRYVMTGQGKLVRPLLVASAFDSVNQSNANDGANDNVSNDDENADKSTDRRTT